MARSSSSSSSSHGDTGVLGLPRARNSNGETGDIITISTLGLPRHDGPVAVVRLSSSFLVLCLRSWSLKAGRRGPISAAGFGIGVARGEGERELLSRWVFGCSGELLD
ncbi:hypothetical protein M0R45_031513 [Rubus argutus]|uniref:Uncharacterized protein n=1 Tax=Rubus argutus TaxID=59490 RepID=A0AAW1WE84_RUBAR